MTAGAAVFYLFAVITVGSAAVVVLARSLIYSAFALLFTFFGVAGLYVGFFIRVKAFKDGMTVPSFYVLAGGKHFDATCCVSGFGADLNVVGNLNKNEATEGWVLFDLPSRHGRLVMEEFGTQEAQAYWTF